MNHMKPSSRLVSSLTQHCVQLLQLLHTHKHKCTHSRSDSGLLKQPITLMSSSMRSKACSSKALPMTSTGSSNSCKKTSEYCFIARCTRSTYSTGELIKWTDAMRETVRRKLNPYIQQELHKGVCRKQSIILDYTVRLKNIDTALFLQT